MALELTPEEEQLILKRRQKNEVFNKIKELINEELLTFKELEEFTKSLKPKSNRGRKPKN
jgi:DNA-binding protein H-NS